MPDHDFSDLRALFLNCTLKRRPSRPTPQALMDNSVAIMRCERRRVDTIRPSTTTSPPGVSRT